jgi:hypothetical protein
MSQVRWALWINVVVQGMIVFGAVLMIILSACLFALTITTLNTPLLGAISLLGGMILLFALLFRDPFKHIQNVLNNMVKVDVIFLGFLHQISQIDAAFKQKFITNEDLEQPYVDGSLSRVQDAVDQTNDHVSDYSEL